MDINDIHYIDYGKDKNGTIVLLHGWGQNIEMMDMLGRPFAERFRIINIDMPGFGETPEPNKASNVTDYAKWIYELLTKLKVKNPILVGHSFGGRVAICYASKYKAEKVVLLSTPFRPTKSKASIKVKIYKLVKKVKVLKSLQEYLQDKWGSPDYKSASVITRGTLVKVINEDLTRYAESIECPVLLIYGKLDKDVLITEARTLEKLIPDAGLIEYENGHHYAYLEYLNDTIRILNNFFE